MKHPNRDEWVPFIFGESSPETIETLNRHLAECGDCRTRVEAWRRTLKRLDGWQLPAPGRVRVVAKPAFRWAAAAAIVLGIGFALGRFASPSQDAKAMARLQASLSAQIQEQVRTGVAAEMQRKLGDNQLASSTALAALEARLDAARKSDAVQLGAEFESVLEAQQEEDRALTEALLAKVQENHDKDFLSLRKDLQSVALVADEQLQDTHSKLLQLAAASQR
jgi:hypothetical protein